MRAICARRVWSGLPFELRIMQCGNFIGGKNDKQFWSDAYTRCLNNDHETPVNDIKKSFIEKNQRISTDSF